MPLSQPTSTLVARRMMDVLEALRALRRRTALFLSLAVLAALLAIDFFTGIGINISFAYTLLVCFAAWTLGERHGVGMTVLITIGVATFPHIATTLHADHPLPTLATQLWNSVSRLMSGGLLVLLVGGLRTSLEMERWRAETDGLTGALNKAAFRRRMAATIAHARRTNRALMLAYMDLDGFKAVNDRHGHSAGDAVLTAFARTAAGMIRSRDLFARIGGDEFVALMMVPDCARGDAAAEQLHERLSGILRATGYAVTCSTGAVVVDSAEIGSHDDLIAAADGLMYQVKRSGRNALRLARGGMLGEQLRLAFPPGGGAPAFEALVARIDRAEAALVSRRAA